MFDQLPMASTPPPAPDAAPIDARSGTDASASASMPREHNGTATIAAGQAASGATLSEAGARFLEARGLDPELASTTFAIHTGDGGELVIPHIERGRTVANKHRTIPEKKWWQSAGDDGAITKTWWNHDVLLEAPETVIITEGELDGLAAVQCGFVHTISVPNGTDHKVRDDADDADDGARYHYVWRTLDRLRKVKRFILAVDGDKAGKVAEAELVKRLRPQHCLRVRYPKPAEGFEVCKDLNDTLIQWGERGVKAVIDRAEPYPVKGLYTTNELPPEPVIKPVSTGWASLDEFFRPFAGQFIVLTGYPGAGKSEWVAALCAQLARQHKWHICSAVFEEHARRFAGKIRRAHLGGNTEGHRNDPEGDRFLQERFSWIYQDVLDDDYDMDLGELLEKAEASILRHGTKLLLIDPWNEIEHKRRPGESETDYTGRALRTLKRFAKSYGCAVIVVAHPRKPDRDTAEASLHDISGSQNWANKCDVGLIIRRVEGNLIEIKIRKPRFRESTRLGDVRLAFEWQTGRYLEGSGL